MQAVTDFKYSYLRKSTFYVRVKVPKRLGAREVRLCLRTKKLSVAVLILERLLPLISSLKQLVISSRTLDTNLIYLQFSQIKDAMLKQIEISDIAQASDNEQRLIRFSEIVADLTQEQKWPFLESFSTVIKAMSFVDSDSDNSYNDEGLENQATPLLNSSGYNTDKSSVSHRVLLSKLRASNDVRNKLLSSIFGGDGIGERELKLYNI